MECVSVVCQMLDGCQWNGNDDDDFTGPLGINYRCVYDVFQDDPGASAWWHFLLAMFMIIGILFWIRLIASTASDYFSPTLQRIGIEAKLSDHLAGVTVLAFGNGAPDVFTVIAARKDRLPVGINALLGGVIFVCTVVVGSIALFSGQDGSKTSHNVSGQNDDTTPVASPLPILPLQVRVNSVEFLRDVGSLLLATGCIAIIVAWNYLSTPIALMFLGCYVVFIVVVVVHGDEETRRVTSTSTSNNNNNNNDDLQMQDMYAGEVGAARGPKHNEGNCNDMSNRSRSSSREALLAELHNDYHRPTSPASAYMATMQPINPAAAAAASVPHSAPAASSASFSGVVVAPTVLRGSNSDNSTSSSTIGGIAPSQSTSVSRLLVNSNNNSNSNSASSSSSITARTYGSIENINSSSSSSNVPVRSRSPGSGGLHRSFQPALYQGKIDPTGDVRDAGEGSLSVSPSVSHTSSSPSLSHSPPPPPPPPPYPIHPITTTTTTTTTNTARGCDVPSVASAAQSHTTQRKTSAERSRNTSANLDEEEGEEEQEEEGDESIYTICWNLLLVGLDYLDYLFSFLEYPVHVLQQYSIPTLHPHQLKDPQDVHQNHELVHVFQPELAHSAAPEPPIAPVSMELHAWLRDVRWYPFVVPLLFAYWMGATGFNWTVEAVVRPLICLAVGLVMLCSSSLLPPPFHVGSEEDLLLEMEIAAAEALPAGAEGDDDDGEGQNGKAVTTQTTGVPARLCADGDANATSTLSAATGGDIEQQAASKRNIRLRDEEDAGDEARNGFYGSSSHLLATPSSVSVSPSAASVHHTARVGMSITLWLTIGFFSCIMWIDLLAAELIPCLSCLGLILGIPGSFMALTLLAWGNSIGDLCTNTALAQCGKGTMALGGCYGAPVFNILFGLGLAVLIDGLTDVHTVFGEPPRQDPDSNNNPPSVSGGGDGGHSGMVAAAVYDWYSVVVSLVCLAFVLVTTVGIVIFNKFHIRPALGVYLFVCYGVYSLLQCALLILYDTQE